MQTDVVRDHLIPVRQLTHEAFQPFGEILGPGGNGSSMKEHDFFMSAGEFKFSVPVEEDRIHNGFGIFQYWPNVARLPSGQMKIGLNRPARRDLSFSFMERHLLGTQAFIPLGGKRSVIALAPDTGVDDPRALPNVADLTAFLLEGDVGVNIRPGTWHWSPFPLEDGGQFLLLVREHQNKDMYLVDLESQLGIRGRIDL